MPHGPSFTKLPFGRTGTEVFAAAIDTDEWKSLLGWDIDIAAGFVSGVSNAGGGGKTAAADLWRFTDFDGFAATSIGASVGYAGQGRMLEALYVESDQFSGIRYFYASSTDHLVADSGFNTSLYAVGVKTR